MALTKVTKSGITDNAVDADKIEDGTVLAADLANGAVTADKLASTLDISSKTVTLPNTSVTNAMLAGSIANDKLANSSITVNGSSVSLGGSVSAGSLDWQTVKTSGFTAVAGEGYFCNTNGGAFIATLPASPSAGDTVAFKDYGDDFGTNALTIARNGSNIQGVANNSLISTDRASVVLVYIDATKGWLYTNESNVADLRPAIFTTATGGTITTSGDFKIHSFTGDGCFVVSAIGNAPGVPSGGPAVVDYLVVAGGGGGGYQSTSGGGAGGYRESHSTPVSGCYTASPLVTATGLTVAAQTYPISVGGGGGGSTGAGTAGTSGSNSVFSTITSAGGGGGGSDGSTAGAGGSGGGGANGNSGGAGNTPPVSPSQGNNGGSSSAGTPSGGGGGGAGAVGAAQPSNQGVEGGAGVATLINPATGEAGPGPSRYYAGGGSSGSRPGTLEAAGGIGGGGNGGSCDQTGTDGTANTGGGGGNGRSSGTGGCAPGRAGGSGIVIIRYKYQ